MLKYCGMEGSYPNNFSIEQNLKLDKNSGGQPVDASQYRCLVDRLLYLQATRPDVCFFVNVLSQFVSNPREAHLEVVYRV